MMAQVLVVLLSLLLSALALPSSDVKAHPDSNLPLPATTIAQLDTVPTWLENIAVRPNGDLLVTQLAPAPVLYTVKNPSSKHATLEPIYQWKEPNVTVLLGITETYPDTFAIITGNATANATGYAGTFAVWEAKFSSPKSSNPSIRKIANVPEAMFLNGVIPLPGHPDILLIPDSQFGLLFRLNTRTSKSEVIANRPEFKPYPERQNKTVGFGINGVRIRDGYLYFSNSNLITIFRIALARDGYIAQNGKAKVEIYADLSSATIFVDDFTFSDDGTLWAVANDGNTIVAVAPGGKKVRAVAGAYDQLTVAGGTAAAFGRTKGDRDVLYVCTAGGLDAPVNGSVTEPGKVVGVDTKGYVC
ncbi:hypothetical protein FB567DRAFT_331338 [Paraphoma chrysanthemicola]|uniref:SMP-30/Gluconolactonase/LRE-like region domain-containing protein n=1 Tax=Paraphoma chrysanthemicola TaxID=798071 RepID=A0A8K0R7A8_9PLEO|nr:hypothetical protein FB567DRAFT_331338 [Paraphoma chrysanthemicola]